MENMTSKDKISVIKLLTELQNADKIVHEKEVEYLNEVISSFNLPDSYKKDVDRLTTEEALTAIRELPISKKEQVVKMMGNMIVCDKNINYNEVKLYNKFCVACEIFQEFNLDEYPDMELSGPFVNPEDLMNNSL